MLAGGRSGRAACPSWGVPAGTPVLPARRSRPHHVFCVRFGLRFGLKLVIEFGTQKEVENSIYSLKMELWGHTATRTREEDENMLERGETRVIVG